MLESAVFHYCKTYNQLIFQNDFLTKKLVRLYRYVGV